MSTATIKRIVVGLVAAAAVIGANGGSALASDREDSTRVKFTATYSGGPNQTWTCSGTRFVSERIVRDKETCLVSGAVTGLVAGKAKSDDDLVGPVPNCPPTAALGILPDGSMLCWASDYDGAFATKWSSTYIHNRSTPDTFTVKITAYYKP